MNVCIGHHEIPNFIMALDGPKDDLPTEPDKSFHPFPRLPPELRMQIWRMAIHTDDTPRIHYYSYFNDDDNGRRAGSLAQMIRDYPPSPRQVYSPDSTSPGVLKPIVLRSRPSEYSWTKANSFLYLWNAGLKIACRESRITLMEHFDKQLIPSRQYLCAHQEPDVYLRICPQRDIICFRLSPAGLEASIDMRWDVLLTRLPFFDLPRSREINLALEFDDSWIDGLDMTRGTMLKCLRESSHRGFAMRAHWG